MESQKLTLLLIFSFVIFALLSVQGSSKHHDHHHHLRPTQLFVVGDSYVDTGNIDISLSAAENFPYGITYPGKPSGRFSDGRVLTDFLAKFLKLESPTPYTSYTKIGFRGVRNGINFAYGGTGVFDTSIPLPNMSSQLDNLEKLISDKVLIGDDIDSAVALVSVSGNDYSFYQSSNGGGSSEGFMKLIDSVVKQMTVNLKRVQSMGVKKIVVTGLGPLGCVPMMTASSSYTTCNSTLNSLVEVHNMMLKQAVAQLNALTDNPSVFILDVFDTFTNIIEHKGHILGSRRFKTPLKPCCFGVSSEFSCGSVDDKGNKKYLLCDDPSRAFFWDGVHPTQRGWRTAFRSLKSGLRKFL